MRLLLLMLGICVSVIGIGTTAEARNYPWCAQYGGALGGAKKCSFTTFQQCLADVSGVGGFCIQNSTYHPAHSSRRHHPY